MDSASTLGVADFFFGSATATASLAAISGSFTCVRGSMLPVPNVLDHGPRLASSFDGEGAGTVAGSAECPV